MKNVVSQGIKSDIICKVLHTNNNAVLKWTICC